MPKSITDPEMALRDVLRKHWGYEDFLPLQREAMSAVLGGRDSVVVLPTGGGKSLCYQAPALCRPRGLAVVVSPLISLMKDQVDSLRATGVPAACLNSAVSLEERRRTVGAVRDGALRLLYLAPERLVMESTLALLKAVEVAFVAVDEAHCISTWGHDFRPEYRALRCLKEVFPGIAVHAYTATATPQVRGDIVSELALEAPEVLVGSFDRPNLSYTVRHRGERIRGIRRVVDRHPGESGIVYCLSRAQVERTAAALTELGYRALPYHAGLGDEDRRRHQEAFIRDEADIIVATVAFGMGIDKPNVRFVVHAGMPKSLEAYQQESGRAGRDGLEGECWLFHSPQDYVLWKNLIERGEAEAMPSALRSLQAMAEYCASVVCRRKTLLEYFGEPYEKTPCGGCDVCLGELELVEDPLTLGQKILSCVVRLRQAFGGDYTAMVLGGSRDQRILQNGHDQLSTYGLLPDERRRTIRDWIEQLVGQGFLGKVGEFNVLRVTPEGWRVLRGEVSPRLLKPRPGRDRKTRRRAHRQEEAPADSWEGADRGLFEVLRSLRRDRAAARGVPAYVVFGDAALREMARHRPATVESFLRVKGVGEKRCADHGEAFVACIRTYCFEQGLPLDQWAGG